MFESFDINFVIFGVMPYVALTVFLVGSIARYERDPFTWKSSSSQLLRRKQLIWGQSCSTSASLRCSSVTCGAVHAGLGAGCVRGSLWAEAVDGCADRWPAGLAALVGGTMLIHRRLTDPRIRATSTTLDILIMILIWLQLAIGLLTITQSLQHMDGAEMIRFMEWSQSVVTWNVNAWVTVVDVHWLFKLHIFLGLIITMLFPFTRRWSTSGPASRLLSAICSRGPAIRSCGRAAAARWKKRRRAFDARQAKPGPSATTPAE